MVASDTRVVLWDVEAGTSQQVMPFEGGLITRAVLSPDGELIAVVSVDGKVRLYNPTNASFVKEIKADDNALWSVAFSQDGAHLVTASSDEVVTLWDISSGQQLSTFAGHSGGATDIAYLSDQVTLVVVDRKGNLHLWDTISGRRLTDPWPAHEGASWRLVVHSDGKQFSTTGDDGRVLHWDVLSIKRACEIGGHAFDETRRRQILGDTDNSVACGLRSKPLVE